MRIIGYFTWAFAVLLAFPLLGRAEPTGFFDLLQKQTETVLKRPPPASPLRPDRRGAEFRSEFLDAAVEKAPVGDGIQTVTGVPIQLDVLLRASVCIASLQEENGGERVLIVSDESENGVARNQVFCHALAQSFQTRKPVTLLVRGSTGPSSSWNVQALEAKGKLPTESFLNHTADQLCQLLATAKFSGDSITVIGSREVSGFLGDTLRIYAATYRYSED